MSEQPDDLSASDTPILIVDDNPQYASVLQKTLNGVFGYTDISTVDDTEHAYALIAADPLRFKFLFVDYNFPSGQTGAALLHRLNDEGLLDNKVALLITSDPTPENVQEARSAGAVGVVAKPFDRKQLSELIEKACRAYAARGVDSF